MQGALLSAALLDCAGDLVALVLLVSAGLLPDEPIPTAPAGAIGA